jgi:hypothetical protein
MFNFAESLIVEPYRAFSFIELFFTSRKVIDVADSFENAALD